MPGFGYTGLLPRFGQNVEVLLRHSSVSPFTVCKVDERYAIYRRIKSDTFHLNRSTVWVKWAILIKPSTFKVSLTWFHLNRTLFSLTEPSTFKVSHTCLHLNWTPLQLDDPSGHIPAHSKVTHIMSTLLSERTSIHLYMYTIKTCTHLNKTMFILFNHSVICPRQAHLPSNSHVSYVHGDNYVSRMI